MALKTNQPTPHELVAHHFAIAEPTLVSTQRTVEKNHGRLEIHPWRATDDAVVMRWLDPGRAWPGLHSVAAVTGEHHLDKTVTVETRYYLTIPPADATRIGQAMRWLGDRESGALGAGRGVSGG